jgi:D-glycero-alpha-D-manno-heptose-7-phosphate kinase
MKISVKAPNRIDFAGGTLDLYPLYLFFEGGITVNAGVSIYSNVDIETRDDSKIVINCADLGETESFESISQMNFTGPTALIQRAVKSYQPSTGLNIITRNEAPKGSGLGASSSLLMTVSTALLKLENKEIDIHSMIDRGASIEAALLGIPTGKQDYYGAVLGKIHALHFNEIRCHTEELVIDSKFKDELDKSLIISFTGISHYSGATNWDMLKMVIEKTGNAHNNLSKIKDITGFMREAFLQKDFEKVGKYVGMEWESRKQLAPGVTNDFIDNIIGKLTDCGAWGSKLCGAGGGGCMITLIPPEKREKALSELEKTGIRVMDARIDYEGIKITDQ